MAKQLGALNLGVSFYQAYSDPPVTPVLESLVSSFGPMGISHTCGVHIQAITYTNNK